jgi:hypothetical protein
VVEVVYLVKELLAFINVTESDEGVTQPLLSGLLVYFLRIVILGLRDQAPIKHSLERVLGVNTELELINLIVAVELLVKHLCLLLLHEVFVSLIWVYCI